MPDKCLAPPCGLYCGCCEDKLITKECHGCGCDCGECAGQFHAVHCAISLCAKSRGHESCADCPDFPCTKLIQFANDPVWRTHQAALENLRRRQKIGTAKWIEEQKAYWMDRKRLYCEIRHHQECSEKAKDWGKKA